MGKFIRFLIASSLALLAASCAGGDDETVPTQFIAFQLLATGVVPPGVAPLPSQVTVVTSAGQLDALRLGRFTVPESLANFDFAQGDVVYVEANGDRDPTSVVRLLQVTRSSGSDFVTIETCSTVAREQGPHRPYALYTMPKVMTVDSIANSLGFFDCPSAKRLPATFVAGGSAAPFCCLEPRPPTLIRDQATLAALVALLPAGTVPPQYAAPDFSQVTLVYLESTGEFDPQAYVRLMGAYESVDASRDLVAERCGVITDFEAPYASYAIYAIARVVPTARLAYVVNSPPDCLTAR